MRDPDVWLSHPSWFLVPSSVKDGDGSSGGTEQVRITAHKSGHQTEPPTIQRFRRSRFKGGTLLHVDLSQAELRTAAVLSGEPSLIAAYVDGHDLHSRRASFIWADSLFDKYPEFRDHPPEQWASLSSEFKRYERQVSKMVNFADLFRSGAETMQAQIYAKAGFSVPFELLQEAVRSRPKARPVLYSWQETLLQEAYANGRLTLPMVGSHRTFMNRATDSSAKWEGNEIVNYPVQALAAMTLLDWQNLFNRATWSDPHIHLYLNVYDAWEADVAPGHEDRALSLVQSTFEELTDTGFWGRLQNHTGHVVPLEYDAETHKEPAHAE